MAFTTTEHPGRPAPRSTFTPADAGSHTFGVTFAFGRRPDLHAQDTANAANPAYNYLQKDISVIPAAMAGFSFGRLPANTAAGTPISATVSAIDMYGNTVPGYTGTVTFSSGDPQAVLPASTSFTAADAGTRTVSFTYKTAGSQTIAVQDTANAGFSASSSRGHQGRCRQPVLPRRPAGLTAAGVAVPTLMVTDAYGNPASGYIGTVVLSSSDAQAGLPAAYTFTSKDAGVHTFSVTLKTAGSQAITATDKANAAFTAVPARDRRDRLNAAGSFVVTGFPATTAGVAQSSTVSVRDPSGNVTTGYTGTVTLSSSDAQASCPPAPPLPRG